MFRVSFLLLFYFSLSVFLNGTLLAQEPTISYTPLEVLVPSTKLPPELELRNSNNNLDLIKYDGRYYMAGRTAPTHFASKKTKLYILSSDDLNNWVLEIEIHMGSDLREPRFLALNGELFFYFFQGGKKAYKFEPQHFWMATKDAEGNWKPKKLEELDGYIPWRLKTRKLDGVAYMSAYYGKDIYKSSHKAQMRLFTSTDGHTWTPISEEAQVTEVNAEEGEIEFDEEGNLWATVRLEGSGAFVAYADKDSLYHWHLTKTKDKYDSALMFSHKGKIYLISRRNLDGDFDKAPKWLPYSLRHKINLARYWWTPKVTAMFQLDKQTRQMHHLFDFPSTGDTAFPGIAELTDSSYVLLNYSSDFKKRTKSWLAGQLGKTYIYSTELIFHEGNKPNAELE